MISNFSTFGNYSLYSFQLLVFLGQFQIEMELEKKKNELLFFYINVFANINA